MPVSVPAGGGDIPKTTQKKINKKPKSRSPKNSNETPFPKPRELPNITYDVMPVERFELKKTFRGHKDTISGLAVHPTQEIVATASDDRMWKMWNMPRGELIMSGSGHKDWIAALDFHPKGHLLSTASGDNTVKLWDFNKGKCTKTLADHTQAVWDCCFDGFNGDFLASVSMDQTARIWDTMTGKCRQTFRGHVDSINSVAFQPGTVNLCTASGDKTVSLWDIRTALCIQTFYGHENAVLSCNFTHQGDAIASTDSDGVIKVWDIRKVTERQHISTTESGKPGAPLNDVKFDRSGERLVAASDNCAMGITVYGLKDGRYELLDNLSGPEGPVHKLAIAPNGKYMMCAGKEAFRLFGLR